MHLGLSQRKECHACTVESLHLLCVAAVCVGAGFLSGYKSAEPHATKTIELIAAVTVHHHWRTVCARIPSNALNSAFMCSVERTIGGSPWVLIECEEW